jgi:curved DNA-binding protein CbpA
MMEEHAWQRELDDSMRMEARARAILEVAPGASQADIRFAFRRAARECHPDLNPSEPGSQERFKDAVAAYRFLAEGARDERLLEAAGQQRGPDDSGYNLDNSWGYFLWWREKFF